MKRKTILFFVVAFITVTNLFSQENKKVGFLAETYWSNSFALYTGATWNGFFAFGYGYETENFSEFAFGAGLAYNYFLEKSGTCFRAQFEYDITNNEPMAWGFISQQIGNFPIQPCIYGDTFKEFSLGFTGTLPINKHMEAYIWTRYGTQNKLQTTLQLNIMF